MLAEMLVALVTIFADKALAAAALEPSAGSQLSMKGTEDLLRAPEAKYENKTDSLMAQNTSQSEHNCVVPCASMKLAVTSVRRELTDEQRDVLEAEVHCKDAILQLGDGEAAKERCKELYAWSESQAYTPTLGPGHAEKKAFQYCNIFAGEKGDYCIKNP